MLRSARFVVIVALCLLGGASPCLGFSPRGEGRALRAFALEEWTVRALGRLWSFLGTPQTMKAGASADPSGACGDGLAPTCGQQQPDGEAGLSADPHGGM